MGKKLWIDDVRPAPDGYVWLHSVNEAKKYIQSCVNYVQRKMDMGQQCFLNRDPAGRTACYQSAEYGDIELIDIDHDAGDYVIDGGDYIKLLDWLEEMCYNYPIRIHSMNPVGVEKMRMIVRKNGWELVH